MSLVVDASVAVKWVVDEEGRRAARELLLQGRERIAPEFLLIEVANILRSKTARNLFPNGQATPALKAVKDVFARFVHDHTLVDRALELAMQLNHSVYDCMYLACAEYSNANFITADTKLISKLKGAGDFAYVQNLSSH